MNCSTQIQIEEYTSNNQEDILHLIVNIQQKEFGIDITAENQPDLCNIDAFYQNGSGNFWIALFNGKVVGTISLLDIGNEQAALRKMFVDQKFRGKKYQVAPMLLDNLIKWAREKGIKDIYLGTTPQFLAAHRFYEKHGFNEIIQDLLPITFPIMKVDTKFYKREL